MDYAHIVTFSGEESSRFSRFADFLLKAGISCKVTAEGRDPLTSRHVLVRGDLVSSVHDGYLRYVVVREDGSGIEFWVAGSNAIRSVATSRVAFAFASDEYHQASIAATRTQGFVPGLMASLGIGDPVWQRLDRAPSQRTVDELQFLLECIRGTGTDIAREAALALRAFATFVTTRKSQQGLTEESLLQALASITDRDTRVAIIEDLGYVGTFASMPLLARHATSLDDDPHVRWAAGVALSRLPGDHVIEPLITLVNTSEGWVAAGGLLGLARHASSANQSTLEPVFAELLEPNADEVLQRYACLGISRFDRLDMSTVRLLLGLLGQGDRGLDVRGFAALALTGCLMTIGDEGRLKAGEIISALVADMPGMGRAPELVWGLEFLAELAALLELNEPSAYLHRELADRFDDWRSQYYSALASYELGEAACRDGDSSSALEQFQDALEALTPLTGYDNAIEETIRFRREIVSARLALHEALSAWQSALDSQDVLEVAGELDDVANTYARYSRPLRSSATTIKSLSKRETEYIRQTYRTIQVLKLAMQLDADIRSHADDTATAAVLVRRLNDALSALRSQTASDAPLGPRRLITDLASTVDRLRLAIGLPTAEVDDLSEAVSELRLIVGRGTWPMPARACPVGGLGRGTIDVLQEDLPGTGSETAPYLFARGNPAVLNVVVELSEMSAAGTTSAWAACSVGGNELSQRLDTVEGPARVSFVLPDVLSPATATRCDIRLVYRARDCQQTPASKTIYLRRATD